MSRCVFFIVPILLFIAQSSFAQPAIVRVRCHEEDAGAKVFVNGKPKGECPRFELLLKPGKYTFTVKKELADDSYYFWKKELDIYTDTFPLIEPELQHYYTEKYYFRRCTKTSINGCEEYLKQYPQGKYANKVLSDLEKFYFAQCSAEKSEDCRHYLKRFPNGEYAKKAAEAIEDASMAQCRETNYDGCEEYLEQYPQGKYVKKVRSDLEKFYFAQCNADNPRGCRHYLKKFPNSKYAKKAAEAIEDASMAQCRETNYDGCEEYLEQYPQGKYVKKVRSDLEKFYFAQCNADNPRGCRHYLKRFSNGKYAKKAAEAIEDASMAQCREANRDGCEEYLKQYPKGKYAGNAKSIIEKSSWQSCRNKYEMSCRDYLEKYPHGQYVKQAKKILAEFPNTRKHYTDSITGMKFVYVPGGCYQMGDTFGEGNSDETPVHEVCVNGFYMGQYEVTQGEYTKIMGSNPSKFKNGDNFPVEEVSWNDARDFIKKLNDRSGKNYRLPTEAEWEYAAREGGKKVRFGTGKDTIGPDEANFDARNKYKKAYSRAGQYREQTTPVGSFSPNSLGLYDMSGNVWEWCRDWHGREYYGSSPKDNPPGPSRGSYRVARSGGWNNYPVIGRVAYRRSVIPGFMYGDLGFRLVLPSGQ